MNTDFIDNSNKRARYLQPERIYCATHLLARPTMEPSGEYPERCWTGKSVNEKCKIMIVKPDGTEVEA
jgi:hypothetical protein